MAGVEAVLEPDPRQPVALALEPDCGQLIRFPASPRGRGRRPPPLCLPPLGPAGNGSQPHSIAIRTDPVAREFIYHMRGLSKTYPGNRKVLENIHLSFYPDAKIGVLGVNGAGKSTLLRIMAGIDKDWNGEAWVAQGARVGYLPQEPQLNPEKNVRENVMEGVT